MVSFRGSVGKHHFLIELGKESQITVKIDHPLKQVLRKPNLSIRMVACSVELSKFGLRFKARGPIKGQCLANFLAELPPAKDNSEAWWTLHVDEASTSKGNDTSITLEGLDNISIEESIRFD
ncbi:hypothetical protein JHK82_055488 [Glycine max]|uniref:Uncharacterized protein n=1 Tax=Glycine max TaxID=3847 RepID=A0A0R0E7L1_SOYBN|nr:hypothetical protein JHK86_055320 [Glycine max]KAG4918046.1 hypothetical protein JHK85_056327 [Glycine max]KAG5074125.1 hypothetical protein JHK84_055356 [Glycine max]KAG5076793.1 hypothetical protein JHK82_055488 [Glycine max]KAH1034779.1 hypothetical protein GYH30_054955 [Glycine max]